MGTSADRWDRAGNERERERACGLAWRAKMGWRWAKKGEGRVWALGRSWPKLIWEEYYFFFFSISFLLYLYIYIYM